MLCGACSATSTAGTGSETSFIACVNDVDDDGDGLIDCADPDCAVHEVCAAMDAGMSGRDATMVPQDACASIDVAAQEGTAPVDIIWVVDSSGSMRGEAEIVQNNLNMFSAAIGATGIDYHVVVISSSSFISVPPPLGTDMERFRFVDVSVSSSGSLDRLLGEFDTYSDFLREDAVTHFVVVTDDESGRGAADFRTEMMSRLGHSFYVHSIASPPGSTNCMTVPLLGMVCDDGCSGPGGEAADNGDIYWELSGMTAGRTFSICTSDWSGLFTTLSDTISVPTPLPCVYELPEPPDGLTLDRMRVNIIYTDASGMPQTIPNVGSFGRCGATGGWYYDEAGAMTRIVLCPATCTQLSGDLAGQVSVALGCETLVI